MRLKRAQQRLSRTKTQLGMERLRKALCEPARLQIVEALAAGEITVSDLALAINRAPAATSQHLRVLRHLGLVEGTHRGTAVYYRLTGNAATGQLERVLQSLATVADSESA